MSSSSSFMPLTTLHHNKKIYCQLLKNALPSTQDKTLFITNSSNNLNIIANRTSQSNYLRRKVANITRQPVVASDQSKHVARCTYLRQEWIRNQC